MIVGSKKLQRKAKAGATLVDAMVAFAVFGVAAVSLFAGISFGFSTIGATREELRANQILLEKMETIRLYTWEQINTPGFVPNTFTAHYYPPNVGSTNGVGSGVEYQGVVRISSGPSGHSYSDEVRQVVVGLRWSSGDRTISRSVTSLVSKHGMQRYIY